MPQHHHCCIPGCSKEVSEERKLSKDPVLYAHFHSPSPKFAKNGEDREWRESMMKIVLGYRDPKTTQILQQYHKDQVRICERHFLEEDIISRPPAEGSTGKIHKRLRIGALPCQNLPKKGGQLLPNPYAKVIPKKQARKPPAERTLTPIIKHKTFANLVSSAKRLLNKKNMDWKIEIDEDIIKMIKQDENGHDQNQFTIWIKGNFKIGISYFSWCLPPGHPVCEYDLHINSLQSFLKHIDLMKLCKGIIVPVGVGVQELDLITHTVTKKADPFSYHTVSSSILAHRLSNCEVLVQSGEDHCKVCAERNKILVRKWCENQIAMQKPRKRLSPFEVEHFMEKRLKYTVKVTNSGLRADLRVDGPADPSEKLKENLHPKPPKLDIPPLEEWMKPISKCSELMEGCTKVFGLFWEAQAAKFYRAATKQHLEKLNSGRQWPKELMEFWSEIWQSGTGKIAFKKLAHSGLLAMPSSNHVSKYIKKKIENLESTITQVAGGASDAEGANGYADTDVPISVRHENGILTEAFRQTVLPSGSEIHNLAGSKQEQFQLLFVGDKPGQSNVIPVTMVSQLGNIPASTDGGIQLIPIRHPEQQTFVTTSNKSLVSGLGGIQIRVPVQHGRLAREPGGSVAPCGQIELINIAQPGRQVQPPPGNSTLSPVQHIQLLQMQPNAGVSHPDVPTDWGEEVVVTTDESPDVL